MFSFGLTSVTFRSLPVSEVIRLAAQAGVDFIEWGGDIHVPHGDIAAAEKTKMMTLDAGILISSYGSYIRAGSTATEEFEPVVLTAAALGASCIRIFPGNLSPDQASDAYQEKVARESCQLADIALPYGIMVAFEYHPNTLTETPESTAWLMARTLRPNIKFYWQPNRLHTVEQRLAGLTALGERLLHLHVSSSTDDKQLLALADREALWMRYFDAIPNRAADHCLMIEFVKNSDPEQFLIDAKTLSSWVERLNNRPNTSLPRKIS